MRALFVFLLTSVICLIGAKDASARPSPQRALGSQPSVSPASALQRNAAPRSAQKQAQQLVPSQAQQAGRNLGLRALAARVLAANPNAVSQRQRSALLQRTLGFQPLTPGLQQATPFTTSQASIIWMRRVATPIGGAVLALPSTFTGGYNEVFSITVQSTGLTEFFALHVPQLSSGQSAPLVVGFHGANVTYLDITRTTELVNEAAARGWFFLAPLQWSAVGNGQTHYGSPQSQMQVEAVMEVLLSAYPIDLDRIYGVGFSMGGGAALSYGARHRDRDLGAFAAIVNHTGTAALSHVYDSEPLIRQQMELLFGGTPAASPFEYQRSSSIELDSAGVLIPQGRHMGINLRSVPTQTWYGTNDGLVYLRTQSIALDGFFQALPGATHDLVAVPAAPECFSGGLGGHCWKTLDPIAAYDWLALQQLERDPPFGTVLADRDGLWGLYDLVQDTPDAFSSFGFDVDAGQQTLTLSDLENVGSLALDLGEHGLLAASEFTIKVNSIDGTAHRLEIDGLTAQPIAVSRNGIGTLADCSGSSFPTWCFEPSTGVLQINEPLGASSIWTITR